MRTSDTPNPPISEGARTVTVAPDYVAPKAQPRTGDATKPAAINDSFERVYRMFRPLYKGVWTTWYKHAKPLALYELMRLRHLLNRHNLNEPDGRANLTTPPFREEFRHARSPDGTWNSMEEPWMGAAMTRFSRTVRPEARNPGTVDEILTPNPRTVSRITQTRDTFKPVPFMNLLGAAWLQMEVHDWFDHGLGEPMDLFKVPLAEDDPIRIRTGQPFIYVKRTIPDPTRARDDKGPPTFLNRNTHWWDGSQLYGSDEATTKRLRTMSGGKLKIGADGVLPPNQKGIEDTGFNENWWIGLSMLHTLFVKEHNTIADMLAAKYPAMSDQELYDKARLINAALMAKIHTVEWTPAILPNPILKEAMDANWAGAISGGTKALEWNHVLARVLKSPVTQELFGIVGNPRNLYGHSYHMPEEFVSAYRMHPLLPESIDIIRLGAKTAMETIPLPQTRDAKARAIAQRIPAADLFNSFGQQHPGALVLNNYPNFMQDFDIPFVGPTDLAAIDIIRDCERGVPRYNEFRRQMQLVPITKFEDLTDDPEIIAMLKKVYDNDIEKIHLLIGCQAEAHRPEHFGFGETLFQMFIMVASRRLSADRFFTDDYNAKTYTQEGLDWVDNGTMKSVLLRHMPELAESGLADVDCAFSPWGPKKGEKPAAT